MKITRENFEEGAYRRGVAWEVFYTNRDDEDHDAAEIQKIDVVEHPDVDPVLVDPPGGVPVAHGWGNPWFADDDEAFLMVCFLALDGDAHAIAALREIGA